MVRPEHMVEDVLKSYMHVRVVKTLASMKQAATKYQVAKQAGLSTATVAKILADLTRHGWVESSPYQPTKYRLSQNNPQTAKFLEFLTETGYL